MATQKILTPQELARLSLLGPTTPDPRVPAIGQGQVVAAPQTPQFARTAPDVGMSAPATGGPSNTPNIAVNTRGPMNVIDPVSAVGLGASAAGGLISSIGGFFKKGPSFSEKMSGLKSSLPARSRIPFSPEQREMLPQLFADMNMRLAEIKTRQDPLSQFAQGLEFNSEAISDLKSRALAFRDQAASRLGQEA